MMNLRTLLAEHSRETAIEAAYYAVRELKQSSVPPEARKAHFTDASESEPTVEAQALSGEIVHLIESAEGQSIDDLADERRTHHIRELTRIASELTSTRHRDTQALGTRLLEQLRRG